MAQPNDPNQTIDQSKAPSAENLSLDDLDNLILSEAPEFAEDLKDVAELPVDGTLDLDLDVVDLGDDLTPPEKVNPWRNASGARKFVATILPFLPWMWDVQNKFSIRLRLLSAQTESFVRHLGPNLLNGMKALGSGTAGFLAGRATAFKVLSWPLKLVALAITLLVVATAAFIYRSYTHGVLPEQKEFVMATLEEWSAKSYPIDSETEMDTFYDSPRSIQNIMSLPKMVVNIKPSASSGTNPMAAMEFFLEGLSPEANVEVKDRESEIRDLFQRTMEEMTFDELESGEGKQLLTERLRENVNNVLTNGKIRRVYIKEAIIKP